MEIYLHVDGHSYNETMLEIATIRPNEVLKTVKINACNISVDYMRRRFCYMMAREERLYQRKSRRSSTPLLELFTLVDK